MKCKKKERVKVKEQKRKCIKNNPKREHVKKEKQRRKERQTKGKRKYKGATDKMV